MKKKIKDCSLNKSYNYILDNYNKCDYCSFQERYINGDFIECPKKVVCYGGDPMFPFCEEYAANFNNNHKKDICDNFISEYGEEEIEVEKHDK